MKIIRNLKSLEAQDNVLRDAWKAGALSSAWYDNWIETVYCDVSLYERVKYAVYTFFQRFAL